MEVTLKLEDLECAHCAAKMEKKIAKLDGVLGCMISFLTQKMKLTLADGVALEAVLPEIVAIVKKIEPDCRVIV